MIPVWEESTEHSHPSKPVLKLARDCAERSSDGKLFHNTAPLQPKEHLR